MRLLIVDDEIFAIEGIKAGVNWEVLDFSEVLTANSYAQAVEIMEDTPVEIILCDIEMPNESGLELVAWVNEHHPKTECIILSCHDEFDFARQAVQLRCLDYILKPARYDFLTEVLGNAIQTVKEKNHQDILEGYRAALYRQSVKKQRCGDRRHRGEDSTLHRRASVRGVKRVKPCQYGLCQSGSPDENFQKEVPVYGQ